MRPNSLLFFVWIAGSLFSSLQPQHSFHQFLSFELAVRLAKATSMWNLLKYQIPSNSWNPDQFYCNLSLGKQIVNEFFITFKSKFSFLSIINGHMDIFEISTFSHFILKLELNYPLVTLHAHYISNIKLFHIVLSIYNLNIFHHPQKIPYHKVNHTIT